jgi:succinate dehydrogenase / fumarate reductase cytochrome b subunit
MQSRVLALGSSVGQKLLAAVSGLVLVGWICLHALGSLSALSGAGTMDGYAELLRRSAGGLPVWGQRVLFGAALVVHVSCVARLAWRARRARPSGYRGQGALRSAVAASWLALGGLGLALFLVHHVLQLELGVGLPGFVRGHVYANLVRVCAQPLLGASYVLAAALLGAHVAHGVRAALVSLGAPSRRASERASLALGVVLALAFALVPLAILLGVLS